MNSQLAPYFPLADMLAKTFAPYCEIAIHDLTTPQNSVVYVANGTVTGRKVGQSFDHLIKQVLLNHNFMNDYVANYTFETADHKKIKSSSWLIRDAKKEVIGMLCINCDLTLAGQVQQALSAFLPVQEPEEEETEDQPESEEQLNAVEKIVDDLILHIIKNKDVSKLKRKDNLEIIRFMDQKGIFLVKGAIDKVAETLQISRVTVYSYLDTIHNEEKESK